MIGPRIAQRRLLSSTTSLVTSPRVRSNLRWSDDQLKSKIRPEVNFVNCFGFPPARYALIPKKYRNRTKPFDFLLSCHVKQFGYPPEVDPEKFHLVAPYELDPDCWLDLPWIDQYSGTQYEITTEGFHGSRGVARVKTYGEVLREYEFHSGTKSADPKGKPSGKQTIGLLRRRHVRVDRIIYIGKESNRLEEIEAGIIHSPESVYTEYPDPRRDEWESKTLPALQRLPVSALMKLSTKSRSMLYRARSGRGKPRQKNQKLLASLLRKMGIS